jgi:hypothetical protein
VSESLLIEGGRSVGEIEPPDIKPKLPAISDEEANEAMAHLGLAKLNASTVKALRSAGQTIESSGVVSIGRGIILVTTGHMMNLLEETKDFVGQCMEDEIKVKAITARTAVVHELNNAAKVLLESEEEAGKRPPAPTGVRLPRPGEQIQPHQILAVNGNVHVHQ